MMTTVPAEQISTPDYYAGGLRKSNPNPPATKPAARFSPIEDGIESLIHDLEDHIQTAQTRINSDIAALRNLQEQVFVLEAQKDLDLFDSDPAEQMRKYRAAVEAVTEILYDTEPAEVL